MMKAVQSGGARTPQGTPVVPSSPLTNAPLSTAASPYQTCSTPTPTSPASQSFGEPGALYQPPGPSYSKGAGPLAPAISVSQAGPDVDHHQDFSQHIKSEMMNPTAHSPNTASPHGLPPPPHPASEGGSPLSCVSHLHYSPHSESPQPHFPSVFSHSHPHSQPYYSHLSSPLSHPPQHPHPGHLPPHAHGPPQHPPTPTSQSHDNHGSPHLCPPGPPCPPQHHMNHPPHGGYMPPTSIAPPVSSADHMSLPPTASSPGLAAHHWDMKPPVSAPYMYSWYAPDQQHLLT
ncbi:uncharacterized protein [Procambarus clarkii]|uniref:uncharacterized protein n=1 Tax=Procambarus clarkii TaxID=6728 RepID=UPI001E677B40|nr:leucine-rich repeat extensin-like protein 5 [Procambarus clarkii]